MSRIVLLALLLMGAGTAFCEPATVTNDFRPAAGVTTVDVRELWRAGGDDDEVFFGNIAAVRSDAEGNTLLLDSQLAEVQRIGPDGAHLGAVGKEGDGPGEVRRPNDMFVTDDGTICVLQGFPGRVVRLHPDGTPAGAATYSQGDGAQGQFAVMVRGFAQRDGMVLAGIRMSFGGGSQSTQNYFVAECDPEGRERHNLLGKQSVIDYSDFVLNESDMDFVWRRLAIDPDGRVIIAPARDAMRFEVYSADGELERIFSRPYDPGSRDAAEREQAHQVIAAVGANYPTPPLRITTEDSEPAVAGMWCTSDGRLWVQPGRQPVDLPDGTWVQLDVYDADGHFTRQVALRGDHDPDQDRLSIQPDGRCVVVVGALGAFLNQQAVSNESEEANESEPLEVVCYQLDFQRD